MLATALPGGPVGDTVGAMRASRPWAGWLLLSALLGAGGDARAQTAAGDRAAAQALFDQGVALRDQGRLAEACAKLGESLRLDPGVGTRFNLADCLERTRKFASAWSHFLEVVAATEMAGQPDRAEVARNRAKALEPRLSRLVITPQAPVEGMIVKRNGVVVGPPQWSTAVPVDEGSYRVEASAPGKLPWSQDVQVAGEGRQVSLQIPALVDAPEVSAATPGVAAGPGQQPPSEGVSAATVAGLTIAGVGLVGIGIGSAFGVIAMGKKSDVDALCPDETRCTAQGIATNDEAKTAGTVSTVAFIAGGALLVGGVVIWLAVPSGDGDGQSARLELSPAWLDGGGGALLRGRW